MKTKITKFIMCFQYLLNVVFFNPTDVVHKIHLQCIISYNRYKMSLLEQSKFIKVHFDAIIIHFVVCRKLMPNHSHC